MNDSVRESIIRNSAYGFLLCFFVLIIGAIIFGKGFGRLILLTIIPPYSIYYTQYITRLCTTASAKGMKTKQNELLRLGSLAGVRL